MGFAEIVLFVKSLPEMVRILGEIHATLTQMKQDAIDKEMAKIRSDVSETLKQIEGAKNNEDRKRLSLELALRMSK